MDRNLPLLRLNGLGSLLRVFFRQFLVMLIRGVGYAAILLVVTMFAVLKGIWDQSGVVARTWQNHARIDDRLSIYLFWAIRFVAVVLMLISLIFMSWLIERIVGLC